MRIIAIIQARMGSSRLPGKALKDLIGEPMLVHIHNRVCQSTLINDIIIATTESEKDDIIVDLCHDKKWLFFRGSENDVLDRYYQAARIFNGDIIVRITSDCPIIDASIIDNILKKYLDQPKAPDYASNVYPVRTFPQGLDTEVFSFQALERAWKEDNNPVLREHVTQYIIKNPNIFNIICVTNPIDFSCHRWTVDTIEDFTLIKAIYEHFGHDRFSWTAVLNFLTQNPQLSEINKHIPQKVI
ncbi:MAG TPA: glycosyltransferase family protein [Methanolinea sp.]|nr:glycosyltransferase family protein [Methanolinea sp.]